GPLVRLLKTFHLPDKISTKDTGKGYEIRVEYAFQNLSKKPITVKSVLAGPTVPPKETDRGPDRMVMAGYLEGTTIEVTPHGVEEFKPDKPTIPLTTSKDNSPVMWAGTGSVYFSAIVLPQPVKGGSGKVDYIAAVTGEGTNLDKEPDDRGALVAFETRELKLAADQTITLPFSVYFGPKKRGVIDDSYYVSLPRMYNETLVFK